MLIYLDCSLFAYFYLYALSTHFIIAFLSHINHIKKCYSIFFKKLSYIIYFPNIIYLFFRFLFYQKKRKQMYICLLVSKPWAWHRGFLYSSLLVFSYILFPLIFIFINHCLIQQQRTLKHSYKVDIFEFPYIAGIMAHQ